MIVISDSLVLSPPEGYQPNNPVIGWHNLVTIDSVTAETENADFPISNVANPITAPLSRWQANDTTEQAITVTIDTIEPIDYLAIARHNLGSAGITCMVEGSTDGGSNWFELVQEAQLADDSPALFRFELQALTHVRFPMGSGSAPARIGVMYVGTLLPLQRRIYVGHTPINYGRSSRAIDGKSEGGDFLGRIIISEQLSTSVNLQNMTPAWYRTALEPFIKVCKGVPMFFAWRPGDYPLEVGFAWVTNNPQPQNQRPNGMMQITLEVNGIAS